MLWRTACAGLLALLLAGCSGSGPRKVPVTGTVTWNGDPLASGHILFDPAEGGEGDAGQIQEGTFSLKVKPGKKKVQIRATREADKVDPAMGVKPRVQFIPNRYNDQTILDAEVTIEGENRFEFPLKSMP